MKKIIFALCFICISIVSFSLNFSVGPTGFDLDLNKITTNEVYVLNRTAEPLRLEVYLENDKNFNKNFGLEDKISVFPKKMIVKPGESQVVRFRIKPNSISQNGEYKTFMLFKEIPQNVKSDTKSSSAKVSIVTEIGIAIYGTKGEK